MALDLGQAGAQHGGGSRAASIILVKAALADARHYARNRAGYDRGAPREPTVCRRSIWKRSFPSSRDARRC